MAKHVLALPPPPSCTPGWPTFTSGPSRSRSPPSLAGCWSPRSPTLSRSSDLRVFSCRSPLPRSGGSPPLPRIPLVHPTPPFPLLSGFSPSFHPFSCFPPPKNPSHFSFLFFWSPVSHEEYPARAMPIEVEQDPNYVEFKPLPRVNEPLEHKRRRLRLSSR